MSLFIFLDFSYSSPYAFQGMPILCTKLYCTFRFMGRRYARLSTLPRDFHLSLHNMKLTIREHLSGKLQEKATRFREKEAKGHEECRQFVHEIHVISRSCLTAQTKQTRRYSDKPGTMTRVHKLSLRIINMKCKILEPDKLVFRRGKLHVMPSKESTENQNKVSRFDLAVILKVRA